jgi:F-type H+-transporting ATPase subunit epsilon
MSENFNLEIISPEKILLKAEVTEVVLPSFEGQMTILKNHIALVTFLRPGLVEVHSKQEVAKYFVEEGTVEFKDNSLLILSSSAVNTKNLSLDLINEKIKRSEEKLNLSEITDKEKYILSYKIQTLQEINL